MDELPGEFTESGWFQRGWTLQELIAPKSVRFYTRDWRFTGNKTSHSHQISTATSIDVAILRNKRTPSSVSVAKRMSWAANRDTSRVEDQAYCLLGLFGVSIPMLHGEGPQAFIRLQEEIIRISNDQSIFAWGIGSVKGCGGSLLAPSPSAFDACNAIVSWGSPGQYEMTNRGLRTQIPVLRTGLFFDSGRSEDEYCAILNCHYEDDFSGTLALRIRRVNVESDDEYALSTNGSRVAFVDASSSPTVLDGLHSLHRPQVPTELRVSDRLAFMEISVLHTAPSTLIYIARSYESIPSEPKFWLRLRHSGYEATHKVIVADRHPIHAGNAETSIMHISDTTDHESARGAVLLRSPTSERKAILQFAFDEVVEHHASEQIHLPAFRTIAGLQARTISPFDQADSSAFRRHLKKLTSSAACEHHLGLCQNFTEHGLCAVTPLSQQLAWDTETGIEGLDATISEASVMGQDLVIVDAHMWSLPFELDSHPVELEGADTEEVLAFRAQRRAQVLSEYPLSSYLDAWKINVQFGEDARQTIARDGDLAAAVAMTDTLALIPGVHEIPGTADLYDRSGSPYMFEAEPVSATVKEPDSMLVGASTWLLGEWDGIWRENTPVPGTLSHPDVDIDIIWHEPSRADPSGREREQRAREARRAEIEQASFTSTAQARDDRRREIGIELA